MPFSELVKVFAATGKDTGRVLRSIVANYHTNLAKAEARREKQGREKVQDKDNFFPIMRLLLPQVDRARSSYNLKQVRISLSRSCSLALCLSLPHTHTHTHTQSLEISSSRPSSHSRPSLCRSSLAFATLTTSRSTHRNSDRQLHVAPAPPPGTVFHGETVHQSLGTPRP
jgi:hypothetical protein